MKQPPYTVTYIIILIIWAVLGVVSGFLFSWTVAIAWFLSGIVIPKIELKPRVDVRWNEKQE